MVPVTLQHNLYMCVHSYKPVIFMTNSYKSGSMCKNSVYKTYIWQLITSGLLYQKPHVKKSLFITRIHSVRDKAHKFGHKFLAIPKLFLIVIWHEKCTWNLILWLVTELKIKIHELDGNLLYITMTSSTKLGFCKIWIYKLLI